MSKIKGVFFDMDGVLIEAKDWHYEALNKSLGLFGYNITREEHLHRFDGLPTKVKLQKLTEDKGLPVELHGFINEMKQQYTFNIVENLCRPRFDHEYALSKLKAEGYTLACCSNSIKASIELMMKYSHLDKYLDFIVSNQDVKKSKPNPEIYLKALQMANLNADEVIICEDNENGINAAVDAIGSNNVLIINDVSDVNYQNIKNKIMQLELK